MLPMDCHTHTGISPDGTGTVAGHAEQAKRLGLPVLALTEHVEMNRYFPQAHYGILPRNEWEIFDHAAVLEHSLQAVAAEKEQAAADGLTLLCGMEMGQPNADFGLSESVAADVRLDFIIASLHELLEKPDFFCLDYQTENIPALMEAYFSQLYDICRWGHFDVLGHLTYPLRYIEGEAGIPVPLEPYAEQIRCCFRALAENGRGIELNTSGYRQKYGKPFPTLEYLKLYREMGGEVLTFGSDAHCAEDLGKGIADGVALAKAAGFSHACYFVKRKPVFLKLS
ncbi:histidinol-phosphatase HisJ family protein [uncultured Ruminococcus sp.]|uniref:histidinol-phosphatase HisJ family protein n=1 Tax=uncultured Ruminococcus sp. TaxID=165186 RepID=UPI00260A803B|nr:histidinol-phosphatase HisJ family protein [uncultured Ruminococcus sp.]